MQNEFLDFSYYFRLLKEKIVWIILVVVLFTGLMGFITYNKFENNYESQLTILVDTFEEKEYTEESNKVDDLSLYQMLVYTYAELSTSELVLNDIANELNLDMEVDELRKLIKSTPKNNTQTLYLVVETSNKELTEKIIDQLGISLKNVGRKVLKEDLVQIIDKRDLSAGNLSSKLKKDVPIYFFLSLIVIVNIIIVWDLLKQKIRTDEFIKEELGLNILGKIPELK